MMGIDTSIDEPIKVGAKGREDGTIGHAVRVTLWQGRQGQPESARGTKANVIVWGSVGRLLGLCFVLAAGVLLDLNVGTQRFQPGLSKRQTGCGTVVSRKPVRRQEMIVQGPRSQGFPAAS